MDASDNFSNGVSIPIKPAIGVLFFIMCIIAKMVGNLYVWAGSIVFMCVTLIVINGGKIYSKRGIKQFLTILAWILFCGAYLIVSPNVAEFINGAIQMTMFFLLIFYGIFIADSYNEYEKNCMFRAICTIIFITALYGIFEYVFSYNPLSRFFYVQRSLLDDATTRRSMSVYLHPIYFSQVLVIGACINHYFNNNTTKRLIYHLVFFIALYTTKTRGAWITYGVMALYLFLTSLKGKKYINKNRIYLTVAIVVILVIANYRFNLLGSVGERFGQFSDSASIDQRMGALNYILKQFNSSSILNKILGHGVLGTVHELSKVTFNYQDFIATDNQWLSWLYNNGLLFICFLLAIVIYSVVIFYTNKSDNITRFMVTIFLAYLGMSFFVEIGSAFAGNLFLFIPIGYIVRQEIDKKQKDREEEGLLDNE